MNMLKKINRYPYLNQVFAYLFFLSNSKEPVGIRSVRMKSLGFYKLTSLCLFNIRYCAWVLPCINTKARGDKLGSL